MVNGIDNHRRGRRPRRPVPRRRPPPRPDEWCAASTTVRRGGALLRPLCVTKPGWGGQSRPPLRTRPIPLATNDALHHLHHRASGRFMKRPYGEIDACRSRPAVHRPYRGAFGPSIARDPVPLTKKRAGQRPALTDKIDILPSAPTDKTVIPFPFSPPPVSAPPRPRGAALFCSSCRRCRAPRRGSSAWRTAVHRCTPGPPAASATCPRSGPGP